MTDDMEKISCTCSKERAENALISIKAELADMIADGKPIEMKCPYCDRAYEFTIEELKELLNK